MTFKRKRAAWTGALIAAAVSAGVLAAPAAQAADSKPAKLAVSDVPAKKHQGVPAKAEQRASATAASGNVTLVPGDKLLSNEYIETANGFLYMQPDGNLVLDHQYGAELWATGTWGNNGAYAVYQGDGNFVVYKKDGGEGKGGALWSSGTWGNPNGRLDFQDDANLVVYRQDNSAAWSTRTWRVGDNSLVGGENLDSGTWMASANSVLVQDARGYFAVFYRPEVNRDPVGIGIYSIGAYTRMQKDGNLVLYKKGGGEGKGGALWSSETWNSPGAYLVYGASDSSLVLYAANGERLGWFDSND
ncbi:hypothetical protein [Streptomyces sp. NPDC091371]|uniref:hypothetical protein n=1 Tax=Streptomyces sp. NPDC091371 TaxID=3155303 RepID=UPI003446B34A